MKNLLGRIDIGSKEHHVIIMNEKEKILYDRRISHKPCITLYSQAIDKK